ncbi:hypothetical protein Tco_0735426 [Tanacetum coccineum]
MEIPETMNNDVIKESVGYRCYKMKKDGSEKGNAKEEPEEQHVSTVRRGRGKGCMCIGNQEVNVSSKPNQTVVRRKQRTITVVGNIVEHKTKQVEKDVDEGYAAKRGLKLKDTNKDDDKDDTKVSKMDISDDEDNKRDNDDDAAGFRVFVYNKS